MADAFVKICGLSTPDTLDAALDAGAAMVGLVYFPRSPRHVDLDTMAALAQRARGRAQVVVLAVNPDDAQLRALSTRVRPDWFQLHGQEDAGTIEAVRARYGRPILKAVGIAGAADVERANALARVADRVLLDAKPPSDATRPGGLGTAFDWNLLRTLDRTRSFMLSGGLDPANVGLAMAATGLRAVDVSSGVESAPGIKDPDRIAAFIEAARAAARLDDAG